MSAPADITGQRFSKLVALHPTRYRSAEGVLWECQCDCGNVCVASVKALRSGKKKSCGCAKTDREDLSGQRFGKLTVLRDSGERYQGNTIWECRCDCGNITKVRGPSLKDGNTKSCGCLDRERPRPAPPDTVDGTRLSALTAKTPKNNTSGTKGVSWNTQKRKWEAHIKFKGRKFRLGLFDNKQEAITARENAEATVFGKFLKDHPDKKQADSPKAQLETGTRGRKPVDITGQKFGKLTAIRPTSKRVFGCIVWECLCDCGNTTYVRAALLKSGNTKSCGCAKTIRKDNNLLGQKFGMLTVIKPIETRYHGTIIWECRCECGNTVYARTTFLKSGKKKSCGCVKTARLKK